MYAIVEAGGRQIRVAPGDEVLVDRMDAPLGQQLSLGRVLVVVADDGNLAAGDKVAQARAQATVLSHPRGRKIIVFKYHNKVNYRRRTGHRQALTRVRIDGIEGV